jgi:hypothetical protein
MFVALLGSVLGFRLFGGQFLLSRMDIGQKRIRWGQVEGTDDRWRQVFSSAYTIACYDTRFDLVHCFTVENETNQIFEARWTLGPEVIADRGTYKKKVYSNMRRWIAVASPEKPLCCDLRQAPEMAAWFLGHPSEA